MKINTRKLQTVVRKIIAFNEARDWGKAPADIAKSIGKILAPRHYKVP